jgi:hypothetical protein
MSTNATLATIMHGRMTVLSSLRTEFKVLHRPQSAAWRGIRWAGINRVMGSELQDPVAVPSGALRFGTGDRSR